MVLRKERALRCEDVEPRRNEKISAWTAATAEEIATDMAAVVTTAEPLIKTCEMSNAQGDLKPAIEKARNRNKFSPRHLQRRSRLSSHRGRA